MNEMIDTPTPNPALPQGTLLAFARELRLLAAQVERDLRRHSPVSALSVLTAMKPLTGALADAAFAEALGGEASESNEDTPTVNHNGYL